MKRFAVTGEGVEQELTLDEVVALSEELDGEFARQHDLGWHLLDVNVVAVGQMVAIINPTQPFIDHLDVVLRAVERIA